MPSIKSSDLKLVAVACRRGYDYNDLMALGHGQIEIEGNLKIIV